MYPKGRLRRTGYRVGLVLGALFASVFLPALAQTTDWASLIQAAKPAVVWILAETPKGTSAGSGAIISPDGYILTAAHVIEGASRIKVVVEETREYWASVVNADYKADVAILKIPASGLTWFALGDSDKVAIEEQIRVLGYPLPGAGVGLIAVAGVIQGTRVLAGVKLLQHNASTASGHSGGPVINAQGEIIGIHSARLTDQPEYRLAVAVNEAKRLIPWGVLPSGPSPIRPPAGPGLPALVIRVPQDQPDLSAAVRAAPEGGEIQVTRGTYRGDLSITKPLKIAGESGTTIEGTVRITGTRTVTISNVKIIGAVEVRDTTSFTLEQVVVSGSPADGILVEGSTGIISGCTVEDAKSFGIEASFGARVTIIQTAIRRSGKAGIALSLNAQARITGNVIEANQGDGISTDVSTALIQENIIRGNGGCGIRADATSVISGSATSVNLHDNRAGNLCGNALKLDVEPPTITARLEPSPNAAGWNTTDVRVVFICTDPLSGIASCPEPQVFSGEGVYEAAGEATDRAGNRASVTATVRIDRTPPTGQLLIEGGRTETSSTIVTLNIVGNDKLSGIAEMRFSNDGQTWSPWERYETPKRWDLTAYGGIAIEGTKTVYAQLKDLAGNVSTPFSATIALVPSPRPLPPPLNLRVSPSGWSNATQFAVDWDDPPQIPPRAAAWYKVDSPPEHPEDGTRVLEKPFPVKPPGEGEHLVYVWLEDATGRKDHTQASTVRLLCDRTPPELTVGAVEGTMGAEGWYLSDVTVTFIATDNLSGFAPDGRLRLEARRTSSGEGQDVRIQFSISDRAGNTTSLTAGPFRVDKTPPTISAQASRPPDQNGWYNKDVTVSFVCEDKLSGVAYCPPTVTVSKEGQDQVVKGEATDRAGNRATTSIKISLDKTPPAGTLTINDGAAVTTSTSVTLRIQASDNLSGVAAMRFSNDRKTWSDWESFRSTCSWDLTTFGGSSSRGAKTVFCQLRDQAGNVSILSGTIRLGGETVLIGHNGSVESVAFSPDGKILASGSRDDTIKLWDVATGREIRTLQGHTGDVNSVAFSPDGKVLASGSWDKTIKLWDVATGTLLRTLKGHTDYVRSVAFSPDGKVLASGSFDNTIKLWDVATGREIRTLSGHTLDVASVAFSPDGRILASGSVDTTIKLWDVATGALLRTLRGHTGIVHSVAFSPDGKVLASGSWEEVKLWHMATGSVLRTLSGYTGWVRSVAFSPNGKVLASGSEDKTIKLWDVATGTLLGTLKGHTGWVESVAFSPDGKILASGSWDGTILLWDVEAALGKR
jgi:WD40 repeat protein